MDQLIPRRRPEPAPEAVVAGELPPRRRPPERDWRFPATALECCLLLSMLLVGATLAVQHITSVVRAACAQVLPLPVEPPAVAPHGSRPAPDASRNAGKDHGRKSITAAAK